MAYYQDIRVSIVNGTRALNQKGFGLPLIIGDTATGTPETYRLFSSAADVKTIYGEDASEYKMAAAMFSQEPGPSFVAIYSRGTKTVTEALDAVLATDPDFYAIFVPERTKTTLHAVGEWADENKKFFFGCSDDVTVLEDATSTSTNKVLRNYEREAYIIHSSPENYPECAWAGQNLPKDPGSITWKWKYLNGQVAAEYTTTELKTIRDDHGQTITNIGGLPVVNEGKTTSNEYIDVIRGKDWIKARIEEGLYSLFINNDKISMDNVGISKVESVIRSVLMQAGQRNIIAAATTETELAKSDDKKFMYQVTVPEREDIPTDDLAARILPDVEFVYYLAGAIHEAEVNGKIVLKDEE